MSTTPPGTGSRTAAPADKPKRERKPKGPPTLIGTLHAVNKLLQAHTVEDRSKILAFLGENK